MSAFVLVVRVGRLFRAMFASNVLVRLSSLLMPLAVTRTKFPRISTRSEDISTSHGPSHRTMLEPFACGRSAGRRHVHDFRAHVGLILCVASTPPPTTMANIEVCSVTIEYFLGFSHSGAVAGLPVDRGCSIVSCDGQVFCLSMNAADLEPSTCCSDTAPSARDLFRRNAQLIPMLPALSAPIHHVVPCRPKTKVT